VSYNQGLHNLVSKLSTTLQVWVYKLIFKSKFYLKFVSTRNQIAQESNNIHWFLWHAIFPIKRSFHTLPFLTKIISIDMQMSHFFMVKVFFFFFFFRLYMMSHHLKISNDMATYSLYDNIYITKYMKSNVYHEMDSISFKMERKSLYISFLFKLVFNVIIKKYDHFH